MNSHSSKHVYQIVKSYDVSRPSTVFLLFSANLATASYKQRMQSRCPDRE